MNPFRARSASELRAHLVANAPDQVVVEYAEEDALPGGWGSSPEWPLVQTARELGYESVSRLEGGRAPHLDWRGPGTRYVRFELRRTDESLTGAAKSPAQGAVGQGFVRVWSATYLTDAASSTHVSRVVSGDGRDAVMAEALRRAPDAARLVRLARADDFEEVWTEHGGYTAAAEQHHEYRPSEPKLFRDLNPGEAFDRWAARASSPRFSKVDERTAQNLETGGTFAIDPYEGVY